MAGLVHGHRPLLIGQQGIGAVPPAQQDPIPSLGKVIGPDHVPTGPDREDGRLIDQVGQVRPGEPGGAAGDHVQLHVGAELLAPNMRSDQESLDLFRVYLDDIGRYPLLTKEDEIELSQAYEAGLDAQLKLADTSPDDPARPDLEIVADHGEWARRKMIESNLRLVVSIARRFSATGLPLGDLVQEGNLGLLRAVEKFDWRKGFKFSTYATWWIRQAIARGAADRGARAIRLPVHVDEQVGRLRRTQTRMHELLGREPTDDELAAELDIPPERVDWAKHPVQVVTSLDGPVGEDGAALGDFLEDSTVSPEELAVEAVGREALEQVLNALPERERQVLILRFGLDSGTPRTLEEVGAVMGFSRERARQVERDALAALRSPEIRARLEDLVAA